MRKKPPAGSGQNKIYGRSPTAPAEGIFRLVEMISPWVLVGALVIACLLTGLSLAIFGLGRSKQPPQVQSTAIINVIPAPTLTPAPVESVVATPGEGTSVPAGPIGKGSYVKVTGTGGTGLRLRDQPGLNGKVLLLGTEAEVFKIEDGPVQADNYSWWYLVSPFDPDRNGWGVGDYLVVVEAP
jgi:hypothetical protein